MENTITIVMPMAFFYLLTALCVLWLIGQVLNVVNHSIRVKLGKQALRLGIKAERAKKKRDLQGNIIEEKES